MNEEKGWFQSKTNLIALLIFVSSLFSFLEGNEFIQQYPGVVSAIGILSGIVMMVLRYISNSPVRAPFSKKSRDL